MALVARPGRGRQDRARAGSPRTSAAPAAVAYATVARVSETPPGSVRMVRAGERWYALANVDGRFYALDNNCPHNGGPLGRGRLLGRELECPWHQWRWDVATGQACWPAGDWRARRIPVRVVGDDVQLPVL